MGKFGSGAGGVMPTPAMRSSERRMLANCCSCGPRLLSLRFITSARRAAGSVPGWASRLRSPCDVEPMISVAWGTCVLKTSTASRQRTFSRPTNAEVCCCHALTISAREGASPATRPVAGSHAHWPCGATSTQVPLLSMLIGLGCLRSMVTKFVALQIVAQVAFAQAWTFNSPNEAPGRAAPCALASAADR